MKHSFFMLFQCKDCKDFFFFFAKRWNISTVECVIIWASGCSELSNCEQKNYLLEKRSVLFLLSAMLMKQNVRENVHANAFEQISHQIFNREELWRALNQIMEPSGALLLISICWYQRSSRPTLVFIGYHQVPINARFFEPHPIITLGLLSSVESERRNAPFSCVQTRTFTQQQLVKASTFNF